MRAQCGRRDAGAARLPCAAAGRRAAASGSSPPCAAASAHPPHHTTPAAVAGPRAQASFVRLGWSFFAGALGAWVVSSPPSYTGFGFNSGAGFLGLVFYSLAAGLPLLMIAFAGSVIKARGAACSRARRRPPPRTRAHARARGPRLAQPNHNRRPPPQPDQWRPRSPISDAPATRPPASSPQNKVPHVLSLTDFIGWRFGWVAKTYVVLFCLFNMSIGEGASRPVVGAPP